MKNLITIECEQNDIQYDYSLLRKLYKKGCFKSNDWHFLFEPELIIRLNTKEDALDRIETILRKEGIGFIKYQYPLIDSDPKHRVEKIYGDFGLNRFQLTMLNNSCKAYLSLTGREYIRLIERTWHCMHNLAGFNWKDEGLIGMSLAKNRLKMDRMSSLKRLLNYLSI